MTSLHTPALPRDAREDLGDGLVMRWSTHADADNVSALIGDAFKKRLLSGKNVAMSDRDYALVEDTRCEPDQNPIVACVAIHRLRAYYGSSDIIIGKPEMVATNPKYRNRGFIRKLMFDMIHPESEARGDDMQILPGIPYFYRQFGYEYAMVNFMTSKVESIQSIPSLEDGKSEPYVLRKATVEDIPYLIRMSTRERVSPYTQVGIYYGPEYWKYTVGDIMDIPNPMQYGVRDTQIIIDAVTGEDVGYSIVSTPFGMKVEAIVVDESVFINDALYPVLRQLIALEKKRLEAKKAFLQEAEAAKINTTSFPMLLQIHPKHPATALLGSKMVSLATGPGFRLYSRIDDYPRFILKVRKELEKRLAESPMAGITGRLRLNFYRKVEGNKAKGLEIFLEQGKIVDAKEWVHPGGDKLIEEHLAWKAEGKVPQVFNAAFAPLTFHQLLLGDRSLEELIWSYGETNTADETVKLLLNSLFPKGTQHIDTFHW
ncbi:hypothetical protein BGZ98_001983 [Dissophora globulifera]|nr:hypothetical protein BGZ98_001983 [Dissophora globulifera]